MSALEIARKALADIIAAEAENEQQMGEWEAGLAEGLWRCADIASKAIKEIDG